MSPMEAARAEQIAFGKRISPPLISFQPRLPPIIQIPNCECVHKRGRTVFTRRQKEKRRPLSLSAQPMSGQSDAQDDISQRRGGAEVLTSLHLRHPCKTC
jgi:hypothetical protein